MTDNCEKLRKRFENGETNMSVEYCAREDDGSIRWVQKTVLMTRMVVFDTEILAEIPMKMCIRDRVGKHFIEAGGVQKSTGTDQKISGIVEFLLCNISTVSYTHLDVYKRQLMQFLHR